MYTFVQSSLVFTDPPDHTRLRRLVIAAFVPSVINELVGPVSDILSVTAKVCIPEIESRWEHLAASLQGMMTIFMVRHVRATAMGLASAGSVLG
jgi:cytochrome P450